MLKEILLVGLGGGVGSIVRYLSSIFINKYNPSSFPWATFTVNIIGCLLIGLIIGIISKNNLSNEIKLLFVGGFCGGYTTFSTFAVENITLIQTNHISLSILYMAGSVIFGLLSVWLGLVLVK